MLNKRNANVKRREKIKDEERASEKKKEGDSEKIRKTIYWEKNRKRKERREKKTGREAELNKAGLPSACFSSAKLDTDHILNLHKLATALTLIVWGGEAFTPCDAKIWKKFPCSHN